MSRSDWSRDRRAVAAVEFALAVPLLLLLLLVTADVVLLLRARMRVEQAASQVALILAQYSILYEGDFGEALFRIAKSAGAGAELECPAGGSMAVTGLDNSSGTPAVKWRWTNAPPSQPCAFMLTTAGNGPSIAKPAVLGGYAPPAQLSAVVVELAISWSGRVVGRAFLEYLDGLYGRPGSSLATLAGPFTLRSYAVAVPRPGTLPLIKAGKRPP